MPVDAYPLRWPTGWSRTQDPRWSRFKATLAEAREGVVRELALLGATDVVVSSNAVLLRNGLISSRQPRLDDTGVAVCFRLDGEERCIPCDTWVELRENLRAVELSVAALRGLDRWGAKQMVHAAFRGFAALPAGSPGGWRDVLGVPPGAGRGEVEAAFRRLDKEHHPDAGGDPERFREIADAYKQAIA